jgi:hypothetical protein
MYTWHVQCAGVTQSVVAAAAASAPPLIPLRGYPDRIRLTTPCSGVSVAPAHDRT